MGERGSEIGSVYGTVSRGFGGVDIFTSTAIELNGFFVCDVGQADGKEWLGLTKDARTAPEIDPLVFFELDEDNNSVPMKRDFAGETN